MKKLLSIISASLLISCGGSKNEKAMPASGVQRVIKLKGSETVRLVVEKFVKQYDADNLEVILDYSGGGSVLGLMSFLANEADLIFVSKELSVEEFRVLRAKGAIIDTLAIDGVSIIINVSNPVRQLSQEQLSKIYSGKIKNWSEVEGDNFPITLYSRDISSGTYAFFKNKILDSLDYSSDDINLTHNEEIVSNVSSTKNAIGYVGLSYAQNPNVRAIPIMFKEGEPAFYPNYQNIKGNNYKLKRYILMIYSEKADDYLKKMALALKNENTFNLINESGLIPYNFNFDN